MRNSGLDYFRFLPLPEMCHIHPYSKEEMWVKWGEYLGNNCKRVLYPQRTHTHSFPLPYFFKSVVIFIWRWELCYLFGHPHMGGGV